MYRNLSNKINCLANALVPATGIGLFRLLYGLVLLQEIVFLLYFNHLIFDPVPYIDVEFPMIPFFLCLWAIFAVCLVVGYRSQLAAICSYLFWIVFVQFTPLQRDFDGGFDLFMTGTNFFLLFMPIDKAFSLDALRHKLQKPFVNRQAAPAKVSILAYYLPIAICLGFLYFDSAIHKMFAEHWRNGLGAWLPATQPYYVSAIDMSVLLNNELLQKCVGYLIFVFQFTFVFLVQVRQLRAWYLLVGIALHLGIILTLNIYPFGFGMLIFYSLIVPFSWWRWLSGMIVAKQPAMTIFYDEKCPLCNRTALILDHFDIFRCLDFKGVQTFARQYPALNQYSDEALLQDLYTLDDKQQILFGVQAYSQILVKMRYLALLGVMLRIPPIYQLACYKYRQIADNRQRIVCDQTCLPIQPLQDKSWYTALINAHGEQPKRFSQKLYKILLVILVLQLNSSIHYGLLYRLHIDTRASEVGNLLTELSNTAILISQMFLGITPHALYLHDHFQGYDHVLAITYQGEDGVEHWLPFVNEQGRLLAPNWGRVHSMWANIAVTPNIDNQRFSKLLMKVTAFWGKKCGLDLQKTRFNIKLKKNMVASTWLYDLRNQNLQGGWQTIGSATWDNGFAVDLPDNINNL